MLSPAGDFRQAVAASLFWSNDHPPPSQDEDAVTITHPKFKLDLKDGTLKIETSEVIEFRANNKIVFNVGQTEIEMTTSAINVVSGTIFTVGETHVGVDQKHERAPRKIEVQTDIPAKKAYSKPG
jgi:hypothetical protein